MSVAASPLGVIRQPSRVRCGRLSPSLEAEVRPLMLVCSRAACPQANGRGRVLFLHSQRSHAMRSACACTHSIMGTHMVVMLRCVCPCRADGGYDAWGKRGGAGLSPSCETTPCIHGVSWRRIRCSRVTPDPVGRSQYVAWRG